MKMIDYVGVQEFCHVRRDEFKAARFCNVSTVEFSRCWTCLHSFGWKLLDPVKCTQLPGTLFSPVLFLCRQYFSHRTMNVVAIWASLLRWAWSGYLPVWIHFWYSCNLTGNKHFFANISHHTHTVFGIYNFCLQSDLIFVITALTKLKTYLSLENMSFRELFSSPVLLFV